MKKSLAVILSMLLVLGLSVSAFALHQSAQTEYEPGVASNDGVLITLGGSLRVRGELRDNTWDLNDDNSDRSAAMDSRVRINMKAQTSRNTFGYIELESGSCDDIDVSITGLGDFSVPCDGASFPGLAAATYSLDNGNDTSDTYTWGQAPSGATGLYPVGNAKRGDLRIRQAYIAHQGEALGMLTGIKAGHMLLGLPNGLFFDHTQYGDDAILVWSEIPGADGEIALAVIKLAENNTRANAAPFGLAGSAGGPLNAEADDSTAYVLMASLPGDTISIAGDVTYLDDQDFNAGLGTTGTDTEGLHFWNIGVHADAQVMDSLSVKGDAEFQFGEVEQGHFNVNTGTLEELELSGYAWLVGADLDLNDMFSLNAETAFGSGDTRDYSTGNPGDGTPAWDSGNDMEGFITSLGSSQHYTYVYEYRTASAAGATGTGLANTWYINVGASAKATSDLSVSADVYFLRAAKAVAINGALNADGTLNTSKKIGTEIDAKVEYQIEKNLVYYVEGGYLFASDAYDYPQVCENATGCALPGSTATVAQGAIVTGANEDADNAYAVRNGLILSF